MLQRQPGRVRTQFLLFSLAAAALALGWTAFARRDDPPPGPETGGGRRWQGAGEDASARRPAPPEPQTPNHEPQTGSDFPRKPPPQPGEWLARFHEPGQTVDEYKEECRNRRREGRESIVIQPLGDILKNHADVIERTREYVALYYGCPAEVAEPLPMPADAFVERRDQYDAGRILVDLGNRVPAKALVYAGFCAEDLFDGDLNFVFGVGDLRRRVGVYSLARYGAPAGRINDDRITEYPLFLKRTLQVATHEMGHILGMPHCIRYECNMNGSNSLAETDRQPMYLCPECHEKARWNTGFDPKRRYEALAGYYERAGLAKDAAFARRQAR